jgi:predicted transcriptional regulator
MIWNGLPSIKKELTKCIIDNFGLTQRETAKLIGVTPAAICQYMKEKRGKIEIKNKKILIEIKISSERIVQNGENAVITEICRICNIIQRSDKSPFKID